MARFREDRFDTVLLDVGMPRINGYQVAEQMKGLSPEVPVLLVTGRGHDVDAARAEAVGIARVISKPFTPKELLAAIHEVAGAGE